jgi:hypothetical protein
MSCKYTAYGTYVCSVEKFDNTFPNIYTKQSSEKNKGSYSDFCGDDGFSPDGTILTSTCRTANGRYRRTYKQCPNMMWTNNDGNLECEKDDTFPNVFTKPSSEKNKGSYSGSCGDDGFSPDGSILTSTCRTANGRYRRTYKQCPNMMWTNNDGKLECENITSAPTIKVTPIPEYEEPIPEYEEPIPEYEEPIPEYREPAYNNSLQQSQSAFDRMRYPNGRPYAGNL